MEILASSIHRDITDQSSHALLHAEFGVYGEDFPSAIFRILKEKETHLYGEYCAKRPVLEAWEQLQHTVAIILSAMDAEIAGLDRRWDKVKQIKQGMMQQLLTGRVRLVRLEPVVRKGGEQ